MPHLIYHVTAVVSCARCAGDHAALRFAPLTHPIEHEGAAIASHWAACPTNGEPILLRMEANGDA